jgi:hypothetical protein
VRQAAAEEGVAMSKVSLGPGCAVFALFRGVAVLDAARAGHWPRVAFWLAVGLIFVVLDHVGGERHPSRQ